MGSGLEPISARDWDRAKARHLLNRAGFGGTPAETERLAGMSPEAAVSFLVDYENQPSKGSEPDWIEDPGEIRQELLEARLAVREMRIEGMADPEAMEGMREDLKRRQVELRREQRESIERLKLWWFDRMLATGRPLEEKMVLFWAGHFATSAEKVRSPYANYDLNALFRRAATGNFKLLTYEVGCSPAMMVYLDNARSRKEHPNENWARELMELYTLGQGHYTEEDIKAAARAFTGWSTDGEDFAYRRGIHDQGEKVFMGRRGNLNGNDILDIIFERPEAAAFISSKLWGFFAYEGPEEALARALGQTLYTNGYDLKPLLRKMFLSRAFYSERAMGTRIKSPVELAVSMVKALEFEPDALTRMYLVFATGRMGQNLFHPPNVKGWPGGKTWISAGTLMSRYNMSNFIVQGMVTEASPELRREVVQLYRADPEFRETLRQARRKGPTRRAGAARAQTAAGTATEPGMDPAMDMESMAGEAAPAPRVVQLPKAPLDARAFFRPHNGQRVDDVVQSVADRLYSVRLGQEQTRQLAAALAGGSAPAGAFDVENWPEEQLQGTLRLMLSAAEFQLC